MRTLSYDGSPPRRLGWRRLIDSAARWVYACLDIGLISHVKWYAQSGENVAMTSSSPEPQDAAWDADTKFGIAFHEYQLLMEGTDKITDRRQTVNTLFVSINALFLTGVGYLLFQSFQSFQKDRNTFWFLFGFLIIAVFMSVINATWLDLSDSNRRLVDLRIRYMKQLEKHLRHAGVFPVVHVPLEVGEGRVPGHLVDTTRGTYTLEDVLYNPETGKPPLSFSRAEQRVGTMLIGAYWLALLFAGAAYIVLVILPLNGVKLPAWI